MVPSVASLRETRNVVVAVVVVVVAVVVDVPSVASFDPSRGFSRKTEDVPLGGLLWGHSGMLCSIVPRCWILVPSNKSFLH